MIVAYHNGAAVVLSDVAQVNDSVENVRTAGMIDAKPAVLVIIFRQPGANIIDTVDRIYAALPALHASIPADIKLTVGMDRTTTIRASVHDVEFTLLISIALVIMVVFLFLRNLRATLIPGMVVPISLIGTFGVMYLFGYSIDNLSLMALTISTGFVVDDAIVVIENISRYLEEGYTPYRAAVKGTAEIGFTVMSISISLIAVFIPILLMGGIVGPAVPRIRGHPRGGGRGLDGGIADHDADDVRETAAFRARTATRALLSQAAKMSSTAMLAFYERSLKWVLQHPGTDPHRRARHPGRSISTCSRSFRKDFSPNRIPAA